MGGPGSSRWGDYKRRVAVEECWMISTSKLKRSFRQLPQASSGSLWAVEIARGNVKRVHYSIDPCGSDSGEPLLTLTYNCGGPSSHRVELAVELTRTQPNFGGLRRWFSCPLVRDEGTVCSRRVAKLWLPPGQLYFGCSECYDLTHRTSLECHDLDRLLDAMTSRAPDEETAKMSKSAYKALFSQKRIEARKRREHAKSLVMAFDEAFGTT